jgi:hypothetical protein
VLGLPGRRDKHVELSDLPPGAAPSSSHTPWAGGESLAGTGWQVKEILSERQTDRGLKYEVIERKGRETRTIWRYRADIDPEILKDFKAGQRSTKYMVRPTPRR